MADDDDDGLPPVPEAAEPPKPKATRFSVANVVVTHNDETGADALETTPLKGEPKKNGGGHGDGGEDHVDGDDHDHDHDRHLHTLHTPTYHHGRSLRHYLTRDKLPAESHYRNIFSILGGGGKKHARPTMHELQQPPSIVKEEDRGRKAANGDAEGVDGKSAAVVKAGGEANGGGGESDPMLLDPEAPKKGKVVKFGWLDGVFMRCLLNIWGVMLFLRLSWVIGQAGVVQGLLVITLCNIVTGITALSMSAVSTNGQIKGGGIYYMISRSLGPEFGGAIGIMFTIANSIAVATYLIGFCDAVIDMVNDYDANFEPEDGLIGAGRINDIRVIGTAVLIGVLGLAIVGMDWVTRVQIGLLGLLIVSQFDFIIGSFMPKESEKKYGFIGYSSKIFVDNLLGTNYHDYDKGENNQPGFFDVFGVFFPAVTGIVAGANLSGDLKDPATAIPKGTLLAIIVTYISYMAYGMVFGAIYLPEASGIEEEYWAAITGNDSIPHFDNCTFRECEYGSSNDQQSMSKVSYTGFLVYAGCFAATLSSAIASLVGAPRVLQALARDKLYPLIGFFGIGYGANDDPFRGYILVFFIALGCTMIGSLDVVSTLLSNFFVAAYALINMSVFHASITKSPGWRPAFKYYNPWVSLIGTLLCVVVMFLMDWITALITFICVCVLYMYISYRKPEANWGSSTQAQQFVTTLKNIQTLNDVPDHVKNYRPKVLLFSGVPAHRPALVDFANLITKRLSLLICAHINMDPYVRITEASKDNVSAWLKDHSVKAFYSATQSNSFQDGAISTMNLVGLGKLSPNMVLLGFKRNWQGDASGTDEYLNVIHHAFDLQFAVCILRMRNHCDFSEIIASEELVKGNPKKAVAAAERENATENTNKASAKSNTAVKSNYPKTVYRDAEGQELPKHVVNEIAHFLIPKGKGTIDVWWLYDDGGLTLLLPYVLTTRSQYAECQLRVFALANRRDELSAETTKMAGLLAKFRIDYSHVEVIPDVTQKAKEATRNEFKEIIAECKATIPDSELLAQKEKTNRHLRIAECLRQHSTTSDIVIMTLPIPRKGSGSTALYMSWLEIMTRNMPTFLLVRGNQQDVLTYYS